MPWINTEPYKPFFLSFPARVLFLAVALALLVAVYLSWFHMHLSNGEVYNDTNRISTFLFSNISVQHRPDVHLHKVSSLLLNSTTTTTATTTTIPSIDRTKTTIIANNIMPKRNNNYTLDHVLSFQNFVNFFYDKSQGFNKTFEFERFTADSPHKTQRTYPHGWLFFELRYMFISSTMEQLDFCLCVSSGLGNLLSQYWVARGVAFWFHLNFHYTRNLPMPSCQDVSNNRAMGRLENLWTNYLPKSINASSSYPQTLYDKIIAKYNHIPLEHLKVLEKILLIAHTLEESIGVFPHEGPLIFLCHNKYFQQIISYETQYALEQYYIQNLQKPLPPPEKIYNNSQGDVVIHIRCGDIYRSTTEEGGFMTFGFYKQAFEVTQWFTQLPPNTPITIYLQSQLGTKSAREVDRSTMAECRKLVDGIATHFKQVYADRVTDVVVYGDEAIVDDWNRMAHAPLLICGMSTFCLHGALANLHGKVVIPSFGPWHYHYLNGIPNGRQLIPENFFIIYTSINRSCVVSGIRTKNHWSPEQLLDYLYTH